MSESYGSLSARERARALKALLESVGWGIVREVIAQQVHDRVQQLLLSPLESLDAALAQEYAKGEVAGLQLVPATIEAIREEAVQLAAVAEEEEEEEDGRLAQDDGSAFDPGDDAEVSPGRGC